MKIPPGVREAGVSNTGYERVQAAGDELASYSAHAYPHHRQHVPFLVPYAIGQALKKIAAAFYRTAAGAEPVRDWLKGLSPEERREIGQDIATVEYGWPVGMPVCRPLGQGLWEVRSTLPGNRIARVIFCIAQGRMVLLHGFVKKTQKIPNEDLALARRRMKEIEQ